MNDDMPPPMAPLDAEMVVHKIGLSAWGVRASYIPSHKNLHLTLDGERFHFTDLDADDVERLSRFCKSSGSIIEGWNEHQWGPYQQTIHPIIRVTPQGVTHPHREARSK